MDKKIPKAPTEPLKFADIWNSFKADYLPFCDWFVDNESEETYIVIEFMENEPTAYTNKWSREQFKIKVLQNDEERILSAGKKLFQQIKKYCEKCNALPIELGKVMIIRIGSGFETDYKVQAALLKK